MSTQAGLDNEIAVNLPTNGIGEISAAILRQTLVDMTAAIFQGITAPVLIAPPAGTITQGLVITQSGPTAGSQAATLNYNSIIVSGDDYNNASNISNALYLEYGFGGSNMQGAKVGLSVYTHLNNTGNASNPNPFYEGISSLIEAFNPDTSTSSLIALLGYTLLQSGATGYNDIEGGEFAAGIATGATCSARAGLNIVSIGNVRGSTNDQAIVIGANTGDIQWGNGIVFAHLYDGIQGVVSTGTLITSDGQSDTIGSIMDFHTWTISNYIFDFANFTVTGAGVVNAASYDVGATQVVAARRTGWTVATGTASRATFTTSGVTLSTLAGVVMALEQDLIAHGLIGT